MPNFANAWKAIKTTYETSAGKAKPSLKAKALISKPSGIEPACKAVDAVLASTLDAGLPKKATAAGDALLAKADAYVKSLAAQAATETDTATKNAMKAMEKSILKLVEDARDELEEYVEPVFVGTFKNELPTAFGSKWLTDRLPLVGYTPDKRLLVGLDMCVTQFVANPYKFKTREDKRHFANFHRQIDAACDGNTTHLTNAIASLKDPRQAQLKRALQRYIDMLKPIKAKNLVALNALIKLAEKDADLAAEMEDLAII